MFEYCSAEIQICDTASPPNNNNKFGDDVDEDDEDDVINYNDDVTTSDFSALHNTQLPFSDTFAPRVRRQSQKTTVRYKLV